MRARPIQVVMAVAATVAVFAFAAPAHAVATVPDPPTGVNATAENGAALVGWTAPVNNGGSVVTGYTIAASPACPGCTGLTGVGAGRSRLVDGLTNGTPYTFTVVATNAIGDSVPSAPSTAVTPNTTSPCTFDSFPAVPGGSSELAVACNLSTLQGGAGNQYRIEDYPQALWHNGAGRVITTTAATAAAAKVITAAAGHFTAQDVNEHITGIGIPSNAFIVSFTATTATLNKAVGAPGVLKAALLDIDNATGRSVTDATYPVTTSLLSSVSAHFCKPALGTCGTKTDVGVSVSGTRIPHGTVITAVNSATSVTLSLGTIPCPAGVSTANCNQVGIGSRPGVTTFRQVKDATFIAPNKVCSATAGFAAADLNLTVASVGTPAKFAAGDYITAIATGCPAGTTGVTVKTNTLAGANTKLTIGNRNSSAPLNGDAAMSLSSELAVSPTLAAGVPACTSNAASGSNLQGKWLNPGSFDVTALGQPSAPGVNGPMIAQLLVTTGAGSPSFAGYVIPQKALQAGESDTAVHFDIVFPSLLTGIAVCPDPSTVGVATNFRFTAETLSQSSSGNGDVREFADIPAAGPPVTGTAWEHILNGSAPVLTTSGDCTDAYPTTSAGFSCGGS